METVSKETSSDFLPFVSFSYANLCKHRKMKELPNDIKVVYWSRSINTSLLFPGLRSAKTPKSHKSVSYAEENAENEGVDEEDVFKPSDGK